MLTGGAVRLTGSGLGCDDLAQVHRRQPLRPPREMGLHGAIEFGNRMLTYVLSAAVGWAIIAARSAEAPAARASPGWPGRSSGW